MQPTIKTILTEIGLTDNEVVVVQALVSRGAVNPAELARELSLDKSSMYRALEHLAALGFVVALRKQRGTTYTLSSLDPIRDELMQKRAKLDRQTMELDAIVADLKKQALAGARETYIRVERGRDAHIALMEQSLSAKDKVFREKFPMHGSLFSEKQYITYLYDFLARRVKLGIEIRQLYNFTEVDAFLPMMKTRKSLRKEVRILPSEIENNNYFKLWDDYVEIVSFDETKEDFVVITIHDKFVAGLMRSMYDFIYERSAVYHEHVILPTRKIGDTDVSVMGIGTWGIGGYATKNPYNDDLADVQELRHALSVGMNYIDTSHYYGAGYSLPLIARAINNFPREAYFLTCKVGYPVDRRSDVSKLVEQHLHELKVPYMDMLQIHAPVAVSIPIEEVVEEIDRLIDEGKAKYLGVSNFNVEQLALVRRVARHPLVAHEIHYNLMIRANEENGVVAYCKKHAIPMIAFQPLRRGFLVGIEDPILERLAQKYKKTQAQIVLNWLSSKPELMFLVKSTKGSHINENVAALGWKMTKADYAELDRWRMPGYKTPVYDVTGKTPDGLKIWKL